MKFSLFLTFSLLLVACAYSAPIAEDSDPNSAISAPESADTREEDVPIELLPLEVKEVDEADAPSLLAPDKPKPISIPKQDVEVVAISSTTSLPLPPSVTPDKFADLDNIHLSPKLATLYKRLSALDPELLRSGVLKFREILLQSKSRDEFLETLWREKTTNADPRELLQFKSDLNELASFIAEQHPKVLAWFLQTIGGGRPTTTNSKLSFLEKFSEIDEEMSAYPVWNRYWDYWFQSTGDFIAKWG